MNTRALLLSGLLALILVSPAHALSINLLNPGTAGVSSFSWNSAYSHSYGILVVDLYETWSSNAPTFLEFRCLQTTKPILIRKHVRNRTGVDWNRFANELLDPRCNLNDLLDPCPQPAWIPQGWTTSNDWDELSFAQGSDLPRWSDKFNDVFVDELTNHRDFLDFHDGWVSGLGTGPASDAVMKFGIQDGSCLPVNQPFLLAQRPNECSVPVPEPATLFLIGMGLAGGWLGSRRRKD